MYILYLHAYCTHTRTRTRTRTRTQTHIHMLIHAYIYLYIYTRKILFKFYVLEQGATNKKIIDLEKEIQKVKEELKSLTEENMRQSLGN